MVKLKPRATQVLAYLRSQAKGGRLSQSVDQIGAALDCDRVTVHRALKQLKSSGLVRVIRTGRASEYEIDEDTDPLIKSRTEAVQTSKVRECMLCQIGPLFLQGSGLATHFKDDLLKQVQLVLGLCVPTQFSPSCPRASFFQRFAAS